MTLVFDNADAAAVASEECALPRHRTVNARGRPSAQGVPTWRLIDWRVILGAVLVAGFCILDW